MSWVASLQSILSLIRPPLCRAPFAEIRLITVLDTFATGFSLIELDRGITLIGRLTRRKQLWV